MITIRAISFLIPAYIIAQILITPWGPVTIDDPALDMLIDHPVMQRLKDIDQSGPVTYLGFLPSFSRFDHSIGVLALLHQKAHASFKECIAGLLHDASHTAFSHIGDQLFHKPDDTHSYQDLIHLDFLALSGIDKLTEQYGVTLLDLDPDSKDYAALEQPLPDLCADRIEYLIHTASILRYYSDDEIKAIIDDLSFGQGRWFFNHVAQAEKFARLSTHFTKEIYGADWNTSIYWLFTKLIQQALAENIIQESDIKYGTDKEILSALVQKGSCSLLKNMDQLQSNHWSLYKITHDKTEADIWMQPKFRGVDPWVSDSEGRFKRLTSLSAAYAAEFESVKSWCLEGYGLQFARSMVQA